MLKSGIYLQLAPVLFGRGTLGKAGCTAKELGLSNVLVVTDKTLVATGCVAALGDSLDAQNIRVTTWDGVETDTPESSVRAGAAAARRQRVDGVVGIGGGSALDTAKAIAVTAVNGDGILDDIPAYLSRAKTYSTKPLPTILIPTTAGTGTESTFVAVVTSDVLDCKIGLPCTPAYAIVDPLLTVSAPPLVTAFTGLDAFSHAFEALTEEKNTHHSDLLACEAIRLISRWLPAAVSVGTNIEAREHLALAGNYAGIAFNESGVHIGHAVAHALGHAFHIPHGICCALVTAPLTEFVARDYPCKIRRVGEAMGRPVTAGDPAAIGRQVAGHVRALCRETGLPSLREQGVHREQIIALKRPISENPLARTYAGAFTEENIETILSCMYDSYGD
jgi:alcohol dehydrogenase